MKRIFLTLSVVGAFLVSLGLLTGSAGARTPFEPPPDPSAECGGSSGGKPVGQCSDVGLPQSAGCEAGQSGLHNPHCLPGPSAPTTTPAPVTTPATAPVVPSTPSPQVAGAEAGKKKNGAGPTGVAGTAQRGQQLEQLPFTGLETLWLALIGGGMLAIGLVLRARLASQAAGAPEFDSPAASNEGGEERCQETNEGIPFSGLETLGLMLIRAGHARLRAGPQGTLVLALTPS